MTADEPPGESTEPPNVPDPPEQEAPNERARAGNESQNGGAAQQNNAGQNGDDGENTDGDDVYDPDREARLRRDRHAAQQSLGNFTHASVGDQSSFVGRDHISYTIVQNSKGAASPRPRQYHDRELMQGHRVFVSSPSTSGNGTSLDDCHARLLRDGCAVLAGPDGSGRSLLAAVALDAVLRRATPDEPRVRYFSAETAVTRIGQDDFEAGYGYVVSLTSTARSGLAEAINDLQRSARAKGALLVLIVGEKNSDPQRVDHKQPVGSDVLRSLLEHEFQLPSQRIAKLPSAADEAVAGRPLRDVREVAARVARAAIDGANLDSYLHDHVRGLVERMFIKPSEPHDDDADPTDKGKLLRRALLVAQAVNNEGSLTDVTRMAIRLAEIIREVTRTPLPVGTPFAEPTKILLKWSMVEDVVEADRTGPWVRRVKMTNPAMPAAVLEVAWREQHLANSAVLRWLEEMAVPPPGVPWSPEVRLRAAVAIGRIASFDYGTVVALLEKWASHQGNLRARAVAEAVAVMVTDPTIATEVWDRVAAWSRRGLAFRHTALFVYALCVDDEHVADALDLVGRTVGTRQYVGSFIPASVVRAAFATSPRGEQAWGLMRRWLAEVRRDELLEAADLSRTPGLGLTAAVLRPHLGRSLVMVGDGESDDTRPRLFAQARESDDSWAEFVALWRLTLRTVGVESHGRRLLRRWLEELDQGSGAQPEPDSRFSSESTRTSGFHSGDRPTADQANDRFPLDKILDRLLLDLRQDHMTRRYLHFYARVWRDEWGGRNAAAEAALGRALAKI